MPRALAREWTRANRQRKSDQGKRHWTRYGPRYNAERRELHKTDPDRFRRYRQTSYAKNRERILARNRSWAATHKEHLRAYRRRKDFGIEAAEVERLLVAQKGRCAICRADIMVEVPFRGSTRTLVCVDHDHESDGIRGLLCPDCNMGIGQLGDDPARLRAAARYIARFKRKLRTKE